MGKKDGIEPTKITIKVWIAVADKLEKRMNDACLRRDLYLARLLVSEIEHLDQEVAIANSQEAYDHVFERLEGLKRKPMSLALPPDLVKRLNDVCQQKRIVRDAFFNRLFLLLAATPQGLDAILFRGYDGDWKRDVWRKYGDDSATVEMGVLPLASVTDPFWAIREAFEMDHMTVGLHDWTDPESGHQVKVVDVGLENVTLPGNVYTKLLHDQVGNVDLTGLNCYLPDWKVPKHPSSLKRSNELDAIFDQL